MLERLPVQGGVLDRATLGCVPGSLSCGDHRCHVATLDRCHVATLDRCHVATLDRCHVATLSIARISAGVLVLPIPASEMYQRPNVM